jgi:hypothetical protein
MAPRATLMLYRSGMPGVAVPMSSVGVGPTSNERLSATIERGRRPWRAGPPVGGPEDAGDGSGEHRVEGSG